MPKLPPRLYLLLLCSLSACGLRGPLYLPETAKPVETPAAQTTTDAHTDAESDQQSDEEKKSRPASPNETQRR